MAATSFGQDAAADAPTQGNPNSTPGAADPPPKKKLDKGTGDECFDCIADTPSINEPAEEQPTLPVKGMDSSLFHGKVDQERPGTVSDGVDYSLMTQEAKSSNIPPKDRANSMLLEESSHLSENSNMNNNTVDSMQASGNSLRLRKSLASTESEQKGAKQVTMPSKAGGELAAMLERSMTDICLSCEKEKKKDKTTVGETVDLCVCSDRQKGTGARSTEVKFTITWLDLGPKWLQSLVRDPEYVMLNQKTVDKAVIHKHADSYFSTSSGFNNYRGLLNLCIILLVLSNARLFLENIMKYGILINPLELVQFMSSQSHGWSPFAMVMMSNIFIMTSFFTEVGLSKNLVSETVALVMHSTNLVLLLVVPAGIILYCHPNPVFSHFICGIYTVLFLKLVSYSSVNKWCRQAMSPTRRRIRRTKSVSHSDGVVMNAQDETAPVVYPENLNVKDLYYFMFAPTLCYELNFPRTLRIRKRFLLKRFIEMLFLFQLMIGLIQQWMIPAISNARKPLQDMDITRCVERLLKLAIPNHFIWLIFFYWLFHSVLNVIAELMKFGDREFYRDWWNSETVMQFWSNWNVPVHRWAHRHLYKPLLKRGYTRMMASVAVFFLSAFFHEYLVSVPLNMFKVWAFSGMLGQVPLALVQSKYMKGKYGNMVVWLSLILGQPIAILAYVHDYYVLHAVTPTS